MLMSKNIISYLKDVKRLYLYIIIVALIILSSIFITLFFTKKQVEELFDNFEIIFFEEFDKDGTTR